MDRAPLIFDSETIQRKFAEGYRTIKYAQVRREDDGSIFIVKCLTLNPYEISRTLLKNIPLQRSAYTILDTEIRFSVEDLRTLLSMGERSRVNVCIISHYHKDGFDFDVFDASMSKTKEQETKCERLKYLLNTQEPRSLNEMTKIAKTLAPGVINEMGGDKNMLTISKTSPTIEGDAFDFGADSIRFFMGNDGLILNTYVAPDHKMMNGTKIPNVEKNVFGPFESQKDGPTRNRT